VTRDEFAARPSKPKVMASGPFGSGKSYFAVSFPKVWYQGTEPGGIEFLKLPQNAHLLANLVEYRECLIDPNLGRNEIKALVEEFSAPTLAPRGVVKEGQIYTDLKAAHLAFKEQKVETLVFDNLTYLAQMFWMYINLIIRSDFETKDGKIDTLKMYGYLSSWLYRFMMTHVVSFPGNVVVTCHLKDESAEKLEKKRDKQVSVVPSILGGFRDLAEGMFTASIYLEKKMLRVTDPKTSKVEDQLRYWAYCDTQTAYGSKILAKNRHGLPARMENITYAAIMDVIRGQQTAKPQPKLVEVAK
jgi:hypothetical protein